MALQETLPGTEALMAWAQLHELSEVPHCTEMSLFPLHAVSHPRFSCSLNVDSHWCSLLSKSHLQAHLPACTNARGKQESFCLSARLNVGDFTDFSHSKPGSQTEAKLLGLHLHLAGHTDGSREATRKGRCL